MTQRIFDVDNEKDMSLLWSILPDDVVRIYLEQIECFKLPRCMVDFSDKSKDFFTSFITINWHDKTEITRPMQEATDDDVGKICCFWNENEDEKIYGKMTNRERNIDGLWCVCNHVAYRHARRLTKQEIEELC